jgi:hypothetical protein
MKKISPEELIRTRGKELSREVVESLAKIIGPYSASAQCLEKAKEYNYECKFYQVGTAILVVPNKEEK